MSLTILKCFTFLVRLVLLARGVKVGRGCYIHGLPQLRLKRGAQLEIGDGALLCSWSRFNPLAPARPLSFVANTPHARIVIQRGAGISNSVLSAHESITVGENTQVGAECLIVDSDFHGLPIGSGRPKRSAPVSIGRNVFIGARSIILKGVTIGEGAVIGAGSVVTADIPAHSLAAGNPARIIRSLKTD